MAVPWGTGQVNQGSMYTGGGQTGFDFRKVYGTNPYASLQPTATSFLQGLGDQLGGIWGGSGGGGGFYGNFGADPNSPAVRDYLANSLATQRTGMDQLLKGMASAGMAGRRGGQSVRTLAEDSGAGANRLAATRSLAEGYGTEFKNAMDYNRWLAGQNLAAAQAKSNALTSAGGLYSNLLGALSDWGLGMGDRMRQAYNTDLAYNQDAHARSLAEAAAYRANQDQEQKRALLIRQLQKTLYPEDTSITELTGPFGTQSANDAYPQQQNTLLSQLLSGLGIG